VLSHSELTATSWRAERVRERRPPAPAVLLRNLTKPPELERAARDRLNCPRFPGGCHAFGHFCQSDG
jgi:hypothetical protein